MGEAARRRALGAKNTHERKAWREADDLNKVRLALVIRIDSGARREGRAAGWWLDLPKKAGAR